VECWNVGVQDHVHSLGESIPSFHCSLTPTFGSGYAGLG
jgi:hypothetical protein